MLAFTANGYNVGNFTAAVDIFLCRTKEKFLQLTFSTTLMLNFLLNF